MHDQSALIIGEIDEKMNPGLAHVPPGGYEDLSEQADVPRHLRQPHQPTALEVQEHRVTHMPYLELVPHMCEG
eukprot:3559890-Amphidinium_carterae.1